MGAVLYSVRDWDKHFENAQSRKVEKLGWIPQPIKHDGLTYRRVIQIHGMEVYGAWCLILQVAAKCPKRGVLSDSDGRPLTASDLSFKTGGSESAFQNALKILSGERIGWLASSELVADSHTAGAELNGMEGNGTEGKGKESCAAEAAARNESDSELRDWLTWWNGLKASGLVPHGCNPEEPSQGVLAGWKRVQAKPKLRRLLVDRDAIEREIRASDFCRESWFRLEKLFGGTNRTGGLVIENLLEGAYRNTKPKGGSSVSRTGPGQVYKGD